jgi:hypothetical protein
MSTITISLTAKKQMPEDEMWDLITGNPWFEWVQEAELNDGVFTLAMDDPENQDAVITQSYTITDVINGIGRIPTNTPWGEEIMKGFLDEDLDMNMQDCFWQFMLFNEVVYG